MAWKVITFLAFAAVVSADVSTITPCSEETPKCTVSEVRIDPCPKTQGNCRLKRGTHPQISMDYTPAFTASKLKMEVYKVGLLGRVRWPAVDEDACQFTTCPWNANTPQQLNYSMTLGTKLPHGTFTFEWQVYDEADKSNMCCFATTVKLT